MIYWYVYYMYLLSSMIYMQIEYKISRVSRLFNIMMYRHWQQITHSILQSEQYIMDKEENVSNS